MRSYLLVTGALFAILTVVHVWHIVVEPHLLSHAHELILTAIGAALAVWALRLLRGTAAS